VIRISQEKRPGNAAVYRYSDREVTISLSVIMPAYNEADRIAESVKTTIEALSEWNDAFEVIVVDDGSTDETSSIGASLEKRHSPLVRIVQLQKNSGKGAAFLAGSAAAQGEYIALLDADLDIHPSQIRTLFNVLNSSTAGMAVGSKWHPASQVDYPPLRRLISRAYWRLTQTFFRLPVRDTQTGVKLLRRNVAGDVLPRLLCKRFAFDLELCAAAKRSGYHIVEAPVTLALRRASRLRFRDGIRTMVDTAAIFYRTYVRHHYDSPPVGKAGDDGFARKVAVIGCGYVGLVTGACLADIGHDVVCIDNDAKKIAMLRNNELPIFESGLREISQRGISSGRLGFCSSVAEGIKNAEFIFVAVGTPMGASGDADLSQVVAVAENIGMSLDHPAIVVNKSTVPIETSELVAATISEYSSEHIAVTVVSNPEFLREGSAVLDFMNPDRIVIGADNYDAAQRVKKLYEPLQARVIVTDARTAEMIKYTANAFLATKISFANEISKLCQAVGADVKDVVEGVGSDRRIGAEFMNAGLGFGGSCFPKDVNAMLQISEKHGIRSQLLSAVLAINAAQVEFVADLVERALAGGCQGKVVSVLGLAFKPGTDDIRESPAVRLIEILVKRGATVRAHDPIASAKCVGLFDRRVNFFNDKYQAIAGADATILATEWDEYKNIDFATVQSVMKGSLFVDGRNFYEPAEIADHGLRYIGVGRGTRGKGYSDRLRSPDHRNQMLPGAAV